MANSKEIKRRISSISNTAQITKALQMVSASKTGKAQEYAHKLVPYAQGLLDIVGLMGGLKDAKNPYLKQPENVKKILIIIIGPSRGFVGSLITEQIMQIDKFIDSLRLKHEGLEVVAITKHKVGLKIANILKLKSKYHFADFQESPTMLDISPLNSLVIEGFQNGEYDEVYISYSHFVNTLKQEPMIKKLLPVKLEEVVEQKEQAQSVDFTFEPGREMVLNALLPEYFQTQVLAAIVESIASEHSARMISMKNATDNANELCSKLELVYNRNRQAKITSEIIDIVAGGEI